MRKIIFASAILFCCCSQYVTPDPQPQAGQHLSLTFQCGDMSSTRTATPETRIDNINLYLFPANGDPARHVYIAPAQSVVLEMPKGDYTLFAVANLGYDMGDRTQEYVRAQRTERVPTAVVDAPFPMSAEQAVTVDDDMQIIVSLVRAVAKVNFSFQVAAEFAQSFRPQSVQLCSASHSAALFGSNCPDSADYVADAATVETSEMTFSATYYLLENKQGEVSIIGSQQQKDQSHAPQFASYIAITGEAEGKKVVYRIYLGENNTTDFNVIRNRIYNIDARICGMNTLDWRVSTTELSLEPFAESYTPNTPATTELRIVSTNSPHNTNYLSFRIEKGTGTVAINGKNMFPDTPYPLTTEDGIVRANIVYTQAEPGDVVLRLTITDKYGFSMERQLTTTYKNPELTLTYTQQGNELTIYERAYIDYTITQPGYTGNYTVTIEGVPSVFRGRVGSEVPQTTFTESGNGTFSLRVKPERLGDNPLKIIVADQNGKKVDFNASVIGIPAKAFLKPKFSYSETFLKVNIESTLPVLEDLWITLSIKGERVTLGGSATPVEYKALVMINKGETTCYASVPLDIWVSNTFFNLISYTGTYNRFSANQFVEYILQ